MISIRTAAEERKAQERRQKELVQAKRAALDETNEKIARLRALRLEREQATAEQAKTRPGAKRAAGTGRSR